jgi:hypothetical protein
MVIISHNFVTFWNYTNFSIVCHQWNKNIGANDNQNVPKFYTKFDQLFTIIFIFTGKQIMILDSKLRDEIKRLDKKEW